MKKNDKKSDGFTLIELMFVVVVIAILASISMGYFFKFKQKAYDTLTLAEIDSFKKAQRMHQIDHNSYAGNIGDTVGNDGAASTFSVSGYEPGKGSRITVIAAPDPFIVEAKNTKSSTVIEYNFTTDVITRR